MSPTVWGQGITPQVVEANSQYQLQVDGKTITQSKREILGPKSLTVPNSSIATTTWSERLDGEEARFFSIRRPRGDWSAPKRADYRIRFQSGEFDPKAPAAASPFEAKLMREAPPADDEPINTYCVQFHTQSLPEYQAVVKELGGRVLDYVPNYCHLVSMTPAVAEKTRELEFVRWVGLYQPAYKLSKDLVPAEARAVAAATKFSVYTISKTDTSQALKDIEALGGTGAESPGGRLLVVELTTEQLDNVLELSRIQFVEKWNPIENDMDNARIQGGADFLVSQATVPDGYTGIGMRGHVMEGIFSNHPDFEANSHRALPIAVDDASSDSHGHATFGIIFGSGANDLTGKARGMMPNAQGLYTHNRFLSAPTGSTGVGSRYELVQRLLRDHQVLFQTASWGNGRTTFYTAMSAEMDQIIFDHDIPITQSQSNAGSRLSRPQAWAKNIISVGAVAHLDNSNPDDDSWNAGDASIGPAEDGRIKPNLCAYYDLTRTTAPTGYADFGGTSGATPIVAGHLGLALELWTDGVFGNQLPNPGGNRFSNRPHFTTTKALMIASARQYDFSAASTDNRREHQGWGFPDLKQLYEMRDRIFVVNESDPLQNLLSKTYELHVGSGEPLLKICMSYADPPGNPSDPPTDPERVNDLTLKVTSPDGIVYWGNHGLGAGVTSVPGGTPDVLNTVECVFITSPKAGKWTVEISADELLQDARPESPEIDADFALVALGIQHKKPPILALSGKCIQVHLYEEIGTAVYCPNGVNQIDRLEFVREDDNHWFYKSVVHKNREWAIGKAVFCCDCNCQCQCRVIWIKDPDLGFSQWHQVEEARVIGPDHRCASCK